MKTTSRDETRHRLLEAAAKVFSSVGYRKATVRDICRCAGTNVAAVNYHFRDKSALYREVFRYTDEKASIHVPLPGRDLVGLTKEDKLLAFIRQFLARVLDPSTASSHGRLIAHEMIEPTSALDMVVKKEIRPMADQLEGIVREFLGPRATRKRVLRYGHSIVAQILYYHQSRAIIERLHPEILVTPAEASDLAQHIADFSIAALQAAGRSRT